MVMSKIDLVDCVFGDLVVVRDISSQKKRKYKCQCFKTGLFRNVLQCDLLSGKVRDIGSKMNHGMSRTPEYMVWESMVSRCGNKKDTAYKNYGAKGVTVCDRWQKFIFFYRDMGKRPTAKHSIERIDNKFGYTPLNCKWATRDEQNRNHSRNVTVKYKGKKMILTDACIKAGVCRKKAGYHLLKGRNFTDIVKFLKRINKGERWQK